MFWKTLIYSTKNNSKSFYACCKSKLCIYSFFKYGRRVSCSRVSTRQSGISVYIIENQTLIRWLLFLFKSTAQHYYIGTVWMISSIYQYNCYFFYTRFFYLFYYIYIYIYIHIYIYIYYMIMIMLLIAAHLTRT